jgi:AcrR family transcriptional regulator
MSRWEPNARGRLAEAALALYAERGFEQTTVAEIAARAGLTERTFFRHFGDKREVLFAGSAELLGRLTGTLAATPQDVRPLDAVAAGIEAIAGVMQERRAHSRQRQSVIAATPELQERELIKLAAMATALADALRQRGVPEPAASLAAEAGIAVFRIAFEAWIDDANEQAFVELVRDSFAELRAVTAG